MVDRVLVPHTRRDSFRWSKGHRVEAGMWKTVKSNATRAKLLTNEIAKCAHTESIGMHSVRNVTSQLALHLQLLHFLLITLLRHGFVAHWTNHEFHFRCDQIFCSHWLICRSTSFTRISVGTMRLLCVLLFCITDKSLVQRCVSSMTLMLAYSRRTSGSKKSQGLYQRTPIKFPCMHLVAYMRRIFQDCPDLPMRPD